LFAKVFRFRDRKAIMREVRLYQDRLDRKERQDLKEVFLECGIIQPKFGHLMLEELNYFHLSKTITAAKLVIAGRKYSEKARRKDFSSDAVPEMVQHEPSTRIESGMYALSGLSPKRPSPVIETDATVERKLSRKQVEYALGFAIAQRCGTKEALEYRARKMVDLGANELTIIASLFMLVKEKELDNLLGLMKDESLRMNKQLIKEIVLRYQKIKGFEFKKEEMIRDSNKNKNYISLKMRELVREAEEPEVLLLFLFSKLIEARSAADSSSPVFDEIRFVYAPLAERLGLVFLADDFRDQYLRLCRPKTYEDLVKKVIERIGFDYDGAKKDLRRYAKDLYRYICRSLEWKYQNDPEVDVHHEIFYKSRIKSPYSIWNKVIIREEHPFGQIKDIRGVKFICLNDKVLRDIHETLTRENNYFKANPTDERIRLGGAEGAGAVNWKGIKLVGKDWNGKLVEIQIMTAEMNEENNLGKQATWKYNLRKELEGLKYKDEKGELRSVEQDLDSMEPYEMTTSNYVENFLQVKRWQLTQTKIHPATF
jgi:ppGpp synthetase/RelA/SpoT-type nucleotidyltranferase